MRSSWEEYFINLAKLVATRATCDRLHVGCVLVKDKRVIATGYNGSPPGLDHCDDVGHLMVNNHCERTVHAEANAIAQCSAHGVSTKNAVCFLTHTPCRTCAKLLYTAGIREVFIAHKYGDDGYQKSLFDIFKYL